MGTLFYGLSGQHAWHNNTDGALASRFHRLQIAYIPVSASLSQPLTLPTHASKKDEAEGWRTTANIYHCLAICGGEDQDGTLVPSRMGHRAVQFRLHGAIVENDGDRQKGPGPGLTQVRSCHSVYTLTDPHSQPWVRSYIQSASILYPRPIQSPSRSQPIDKPRENHAISRDLAGDSGRKPSFAEFCPSTEVWSHRYITSNRSDSWVRNSTVCQSVPFFVSHLTIPTSQHYRMFIAPLEALGPCGIYR